MKKLKLLLIVFHVLICYRPAMCQSWCTPNATWWYDHWGLFGNQLGVVTVECAGDTMILGELAHRLSATATGWDYFTNMPYQFNLAQVITKSTVDELSFWDGNQWHLLFDLSAGVGSTWVLDAELLGLGTDRIVEVNVTGTLNIDGIDLRYSEVTFDPPFGSMVSDTIIERIGYKKIYIDPSRTVGMDGDIHALRCYQDNDLFYTTLINAVCDIGTGTTEVPALLQFSLSPNPSSGTVFILATALTGSFYMVITDALGGKVDQRFIKSTSMVDLSHLSNGVYVYQLFAPTGQHLAHGRWIKN